MAIGTIVSGGVFINKGLNQIGLKTGIGGAIKGLFGGEKGSGTTKPNTLPHAIDKLERANDFEAIEAAKKAVQLKLDGKSDLFISDFILDFLGYTPDGSLLKSHKWKYIKEQLDKTAAQVRTSQKTTGGGVMEAGKASVFSGKFGAVGIVMVLLAIGGAFAYANE
jgi:hypothetical protein